MERDHEFFRLKKWLILNAKALRFFRHYVFFLLGAQKARSRSFQLMRSHMASFVLQRDICWACSGIRTLVCRLWQDKNDENTRLQADHGVRAHAQ